MKKKAFARVLVTVIGVTLLAGCTSGETNPKPTTTPTSKPSASSTPKPSATSTPSPTATSTPPVAPSPTKEPAPAPTTKPTINTTVVEIGADELRFEKISGTVLNRYAYDGPGATVAAIEGATKLYGKAPKISYTGDDLVCYGQLNTYAWDNFRISFYTITRDPSQAENGFMASSNGPNENYERVVQTPNGAQVTFSYSKYVAKNPSFPHEESKAEYPYGSGIINEWATALAEPTSKPMPEGEVLPEGETVYAAGAVYSAENDKITSLFAPGYVYGDC